MTTRGPRTVLRILVWVCHSVLLLAIAAWLLALPSPQPWLIALVAVSFAPLLLALRGLYNDQRYTYRWLSVVLVIYVGAGSTEVVASQRTAPAAALVMLAALAELCILMILIRNVPSARYE